VLLNFHNLVQEYSISFLLHLKIFKSYKCYLVKYRDTRFFSCIIHYIKRVNCNWGLWLNKSKIKDWFRLLHVFGVISFKMKRCVLDKTASFHPLFQKRERKAPNGVVLNSTVGLLLSLDARGRGRRRIFSPTFLLSLFLRKHQKDADKDPPLA